MAKISFARIVLCFVLRAMDKVVLGGQLYSRLLTSCDTNTRPGNTYFKTFRRMYAHMPFALLLTVCTDLGASGLNMKKYSIGKYGCVGFILPFAFQASTTLNNT